MYLLNWVVLVLMTVAFGMIAGAVEGHFDTSEDRPAEARLSSAAALLSFLMSIVIAFVTPMSVERVVIATVLFAAFFVLFRGAVEVTRRKQMKQIANRSVPVVIVEQGPYRWIRHPFYVAYVLYWAGVAVATAHWLSYAVLAFMVIFYARAALVEERAILAGSRGPDYQAYKRGKSRFVPFLF